MDQNRLTLKIGQQVGYAQYGDQSGIPLFSFHGTPGSRVFSRIYAQAAQALGLRVIALERPGYGLSASLPGCRLEDYPLLVGEAADQLGIERFMVIGTSGGGMYAAACAALLPQRVSAAGLVSTMMPFRLPGAMEGMAAANRFFFGLARWLPGLSAFLVARLTLASLASADKHVQAGTSPVETITPAAFAIVVEDLRTALAAGGAGVRLDLSNLWRPLAFRLADIRPPVFIWHGDADNLAPVTSGRYLAAQIPNAQATFFPGESHTDPIQKHCDTILAALANGAK